MQVSGRLVGLNKVSGDDYGPWSGDWRFAGPMPR